MQKTYDEFTRRNTVVIAVAQEDEDLDSHAKFLKHFDGKPAFEIVADLGHKQTKGYEPTTAYLIDKQGKVREIFPMMVRHRASWGAILREVDRLNAGS